MTSELIMLVAAIMDQLSVVYHLRSSSMPCTKDLSILPKMNAVSKTGIVFYRELFVFVAVIKSIYVKQNSIIGKRCHAPYYLSA